MSAFAVCLNLAGDDRAAREALRRATAGPAPAGSGGGAGGLASGISPGLSAALSPALSPVLSPCPTPGLAVTRPLARDPATGCLVLGHIVLDDPAALAAGAGRPACRGDPAGRDDGGAVLAAYLRWGPGALARMSGRFAFVLWDPRQRRLLAARDRFGLAPLAFHASPQAVVLAPSPGAVLRGAGLAAEPDEIWIADYLAGYETSPRRTAFRWVERLPPGQLLLAERGRVIVRAWWRLEPARLAPADLAPEALREALASATAAALRGGPAAALLSGGLDSSALALLASGASATPQLALSLRFPQAPELDEGPWIDAVRAAGRFDARDIDGSAAPALALAPDTLDAFDEHAAGAGAGTARLLYRAAAAAGARVVIDGHGGDEVVGHGGWHLHALARAGRWRALWPLARALGRFEGPSALSDPLLHLAAAGPWPLAPALRRLRHAPASDPAAWRALVRRDLAQRTELVARVRQAEAEAGLGFPPETRPHAALLTAPRTALGFEALSALAAAEGVAPRLPFYDARVVRLCLNRPEAAKIAGGRPRAALRAAMAGVLPEAVRLRPGKTDFLPLLAAALRADPAGRIAALRAAAAAGRPAGRGGAGAPVLDYVAPGALCRAADALGAAVTPPAEPLFHLWRAVCLDRWLTRLAQGTQPAAVACPGEAIVA